MSMAMEFLEEALEDLDQDDFFNAFPAEYHYTRSESALKDEGDDWECDYCHDFNIDGYDGLDDDDAESQMRDHIFSTHWFDILKDELRIHFLSKTGRQKILEAKQ